MDEDRNNLDDTTENINEIDSNTEEHNDNENNDAYLLDVVNNDVNYNDTNYDDNNYSNVNDNENKYKKKEPKRKRLLPYIAVALVASLIGGIISPFIVLDYMNDKGLIGKETTPTITIENSENLSAVSAVAHNAMSSVVGITTVSVVQFGFLQQEVDGVGSGVIIDRNGYILTNAHVIDNGDAKDIKVLFSDGEEKPAKVLWYDALLDLAVVKVDATGLPVAKLGDSDNLIIGETVIAIGNPLGLEFQSTVTSGIISGLHRSINVDGNVIEDLIQTDASINPGNSGGPLLNSKGEVIGINTAKITSAEGLGFSIPINTVKPIIEQVIKNGSYKTVFIGITGYEVPYYERRLGIDLGVDEGIVIIAVEPGSPADNAGIMAGDIITKIDDKKIESMSQLKKSLYNYKKGDKAKLTIIRKGKEQVIEIEFSVVK